MKLKSAPQNGPVLSYTVTNDRGWNDPPSFVFSPNTTGNRKRIDLRKRVAHNVNNGYNGSPSQSFQPIQTPPQPTMKPQQPAMNHAMMPQQPAMNHAMTPQQPAMNHTMTPPQLPQAPMTQPTPPVINQQPPSQLNSFSTMYNQPPPTQTNSLNNGFQNMSLAPQENTLHHASSNPDIHQANYVYPTPSVMHHSSSVPAHINQAGQNRIPGHAFGNLTPPANNSNTPPLVQPRSGSATPPQAYIHNDQAQTNGRKMSAPTMPFMNSSIFSQHGTPTMLQASHRRTDSPHPPSPNSMPVNTTQQPSSLPPRISPMPPQTAVPEHLGANIYNRSQSNPEAHRRPSPVSMAPPTSGYYSHRSGGNSPKSMSPGNSGHCSPVPTADPSLMENDNESLSNTLNSLNNFKSRCSCQLTNKLSDDIGKKLQTFENAWRSGKLSNGTKNKMIQLAQAFNSSNIQTADRLHKRLIQEHSGEVTSWIIGIKKLITVFQSIPQ
ncbi:uncharacterized protein [Clytia hemisphaerica]|uniref:uncharacterized protein isoform X2 n=1 Tax=Clytia hemisphaerica TaxID=252671 RepID=UPI0034D48B85